MANLISKVPLFENVSVAVFFLLYLMCRYRWCLLDLFTKRLKLVPYFSEWTLLSHHNEKSGGNKIRKYLKVHRYVLSISVPPIQPKNGLMITHYID